MAIDPVCGKKVEEVFERFCSDHMGQRFCFCSQGCMSTFDGDPLKYMGK